MIASLSLFCVAAAILAVGPRLASASWTLQAPRVAIFTWQALTVGVVVTVMLAGLTLLIPITALAGDLGAVVHACTTSIAMAYGSSQFLPGKLVGALLAVALPVWLVLCAAGVLVSGWRSRRRLRRALRLMTSPGPRPGVVVLDASSPAAFCVPGRRTLTVVTRGALDHLSPGELDGVLAHEAAHLRGRHNLAVALSAILARAFPRVGLFQVAIRETRKLIELLADDAALQRVDRVNLASAIVSLAEMRAPVATLAMAQEGALLRVARLLSPGPPLQPWRYRSAALAALVIMLAPLFIAGYPAVCAALSDLCNVP